MALIVDYNELESLGKTINTSTNEWFGSLQSISNAVQTLAGSSNIHGQAADNVKSYLDVIHSSIIAAFGSILSAHAQNYLLYKTDYQSNVDSALHARILQDEISRIQEAVQKNKTSTQDVDITIKNAIADISDIIHLGFPGSSAVESIEEDIIKDITELDDNIVAVENRHYRSDFTETTQMLDALEQLLHQQLVTQRHYKSNFSVDSLGSNKAFLDFAGALSTLAQVQEGKSDAVERAYAEEEQWQERLYEERQREAETINWLVTGLCIVGSVVAIAATGGAATPLVVATISGISGAVSSGTQSLTSQYVETGDWSDTNWAEFGKDAFVGGIAGFATGYVGASVGNVITSGLGKTPLGSTLLNSPKSLTRFSTGFVIGGSSEGASGILSRGVGAAIKGSLGKNLSAKEVVGQMFDGKAMLFDIVFGGTSNGVGSLKKPVGREVLKENLSKDLLKTKPKNSPDPVKWLNKDGRLFIDGNDVWTYQSSDGVNVCYHDGFPDFQRAGLVEDYYQTNGFNVSDRNADIRDAQKALGKGGKGSGMTWHHYQDGKTLQLVPTEYHDIFRHRGGFSVAKGGK